ncbi:MAG: SsrA-binding protein SmpB [Clostridia bacterium]|mgnify:FL=1|jgi:SsrA-binding protein|nr:SsrA-binding protein SmpB [Clostridia bacterium]
MKQIAYNKYALYEYFVIEKLEAGIALEGAEVKALRAGNCNLKDSFCLLRNGELTLKNMHIPVYDKAGAFSSKDSKRDRRLLLHRSELDRLAGKINEKGYTIVPLQLYFSGSLIKVEIALCKGKQNYDKKRTIAERDQKRALDRELKNYK